VTNTEQSNAKYYAKKDDNIDISKILVIFFKGKQNIISIPHI